MGRFDVFTEQVDIEHNGDEHTYTLRPLKGQHLQTFYGAVKALQQLDVDEGDEADLSQLDESRMSMLHEAAVRCLEHDASEADDDQLDRFVSHHLMELIDPLMRVNMNVDADDIEVDVEQ